MAAAWAYSVGKLLLVAMAALDELLKL